jgi:hypothetical protein
LLAIQVNVTYQATCSHLNNKKANAKAFAFFI